MSQKIVIIGNGPAGLSAAGAARLTDRTAELTVIDMKNYDTFHPCAMPFVIGGYLPSIDSIIENLNYESMKIKLIKNAKVEGIDAEKKKVFVKVKTGEELNLDFDKLILCTGSNPIIPPVQGKELENVFSLKYAEDAEAIKKSANSKEIKNVVIVGGSAIGIEVSSELMHLGKKVTIIEMRSQLMPFKISMDFAEIVQKQLEEFGIIVKTNMRVLSIIGQTKAQSIKYGNAEKEETIKADLVIFATGVRANIDLAKKIGLKISEQLMAIEVNEAMETSVKGIYAAGDCVATYNLVSKHENLAQLAGPAVRQGRVAGINAAGGKAKYPGNINSFIVSSRTFFIGLAGINEEHAKAHNIEVVTAKITSPIKPPYMPTSKNITLKLIAKADDGKILGLEAFGEEMVDVNVNYIAMAIQTGLTVYDIMDIDFCYAPAVSETIYPLVKAADAILRKIERKKAKGG